MVRIAFFNQYVDVDYLEKITKCKVINYIPCVTNQIRLRKCRNHIKTFHLDDYKSSITDICFGMLFDIETEDFDIFSLYHSINSYLKEIKVNTIKVNNVNDFMNGDFKIIEKDVKCLCFVADKSEVNQRSYKRRANKVNFHSKMLVNLLKI